MVASLLVICYKWKVLGEKSILLYPSTQGYKPDLKSLELNWFGQKYFTDVICSFDGEMFTCVFHCLYMFAFDAGFQVS